MELLRSITKVDMVNVPYKGALVTDLLGGQIDVVVDGTAFAQVKGGKLKAIAVTGPRLPALPDVPSIGESVKGYEFTNWWGILAPAGTPAEAVKRINDELTAIAALPEIKERLTNLGLAAQSSTPQQFVDHLRSETEKVDRIVKAASIKFEVKTVRFLAASRVPRFEMGRLAAEQVWTRISGHKVEQAAIDVGYEIVWREST
jgi:tripartite-type tricarboxylate transporter receptor subunit TctC